MTKRKRRHHKLNRAEFIAVMTLTPTSDDPVLNSKICCALRFQIAMRALPAFIARSKGNHLKADVLADAAAFATEGLIHVMEASE